MATAPKTMLNWQNPTIIIVVEWCWNAMSIYLASKQLKNTEIRELP